MSTHKDEKNGTWYVMVRYHDWKGTKRQKCKRGFATRREAQEWEPGRPAEIQGCKEIRQGAGADRRCAV